MSDQPYDPYIPRNGSSSNDARPPSPGPSRKPSSARTAAIQAQIDDTVGLMRENIAKVAQRGETLDSLQSKTESLAVSSQAFVRTAKQVRRKMWLQDVKMRIIIGVTVAVVLTLIIVSIVQAVRHRNNNSVPVANYKAANVAPPSSS